MKKVHFKARFREGKHIRNSNRTLEKNRQFSHSSTNSNSDCLKMDSETAKKTFTAALAKRKGVPTWYWALTALALVWEVAGCFAFSVQVSMSEADMASLPPKQREIWLAMPLWVMSAYAIAVSSGFLGAVGLVLRKRWSRIAFVVSVVAAVVQFSWTFLGTDLFASAGWSAAIFPAFIVTMGTGLVLMSGRPIRNWVH
jgi:hypothetical protein